MVKKLSITNLQLKGKRVLMRVDFNVPLDSSGKITDDTRIKASLQSIKYVLDQGGTLILMSHLGRPIAFDPHLSLAPCAKLLSKVLGKPVVMAPDCIGSSIETLVSELKPGQVLLLENLRFHQGEEHPEKDPEFAKQLAKLGDVYINDAFGTAHRAHSSTAVIAKYFPGNAATGFLVEKEIQFLGQALKNPARPFYAIIGGAKISSKIGVLKALLEKVDALFIGGGMSYTFLKAQGFSIGDSIHEDALLEEAKEIIAEAKKRGIRLFLPQDTVVADRLTKDAVSRIVSTQEGIPAGFQGVDVGPKTVQEYSNAIKDAATVFWNGPLGVFEIPQFAKGTNAIALALARLKAITIVGGGESVAAMDAAGVAYKMSHISTGGGAALEYIEQGTLPGIEALSDLPTTASIGK